MARPIAGTVAEAYLRERGITGARADRSPPFPPALLLSRQTRTCDRDLAGIDRRRHRPRGWITGVHRTWLDPSGARQGADRHAAPGDGPSPRPRRPLRRGAATRMAAGEGIETMLSLRMVLPSMPMVAALSANHLAALLFPPGTAAPLYRPRRRRGR